MSEEPIRPAWSNQFTPDVLRVIELSGPPGGFTPEWAWGGSTGQGVRVAVIDSGIDHDHPCLGDSVRGGVAVEFDEQAENQYRIDADEKPHDLSGHGTACAGIIHTLAPDAELYSVRVLGTNMKGRAIQFAAGLDWAIEQGMQVINLSLSTSREEYFGMFHQLADDAYFKNIILVSAVNNVMAQSYPSLYSSVISVAAHEGQDPYGFDYNPSPPVEFGAPGIDVPIAWLNHEYVVATGNSFAAPHIAGIVALIRSKHPELTPFQMKSVLMACAQNVKKSKDIPHEGHEEK